MATLSCNEFLNGVLYFLQHSLFFLLLSYFLCLTLTDFAPSVALNGFPDLSRDDVALTADTRSSLCPLTLLLQRSDLFT